MPARRPYHINTVASNLLSPENKKPREDNPMREILYTSIHTGESNSNSVDGDYTEAKLYRDRKEEDWIVWDVWGLHREGGLCKWR